MDSSNAGKVNLRIRFAGLNLFVPHHDKKHMHVLMPRGYAHEAHDEVHGEAHREAQDEAAVPGHQLLIHWVRGGRMDCESLAGHHLVLQHDGWSEPGLELPGVFHLRNLARPSGCDEQDHGKVDISTAKPAASLRLHSGRGHIVNPGGKWTINKKRHAMPTVMDWWVRGIDESDLMVMLGRWGVFHRGLPSVSSKKTVDLWIIHAPYTEQKPEWIGSAPLLKGGKAHFAAYFSLLHCSGYTEEPEEPETQADPGDTDPPETPRHSLGQGMFLNCMLAQAGMRGSGGE